jgi:likely translation initiation factor subunit eIF4G
MAIEDKERKYNMSLLDRIKQKRAEMEAAQQNATEAPKTLEEIVEAKQPSSHEEEKDVPTVDTKEKPKVDEPETVTEETPVAEESEPVANNMPSEDKDYETMQPVVAEEEENENEIIAEDTASEETEETVKEESKTTEETIGEEGVEEKPKRRGRPRKHKEETTDESTEESSEEENPILNAIEEEIDKEDKKSKKKSSKKHEEVEKIGMTTIDVLGDQIDVNVSTAEYLNYFVDDEWKEKEKYFLDKVTNIRIEADMNPGTLKFTLADLCALNDEVMPHYLEQKKIYDSLVNKDFGSATAFKIANSTGSNSEERKRSGILALMKAKINGQEINYITLINAVQMRYNALNEIMKMIKYKSDICITMASAIKTEMQLVNG